MIVLRDVVYQHIISESWSNSTRRLKNHFSIQDIPCLSRVHNLGVRHRIYLTMQSAVRGAQETSALAYVLVVVGSSELKLSVILTVCHGMPVSLILHSFLQTVRSVIHSVNWTPSCTLTLTPSNTAAQPLCTHYWKGSMVGPRGCLGILKELTDHSLALS